MKDTFYVIELAKVLAQWKVEQDKRIEVKLKKETQK